MYEHSFCTKVMILKVMLCSPEQRSGFLKLGFWDDYQKETQQSIYVLDVFLLY